MSRAAMTDEVYMQARPLHTPTSLNRALSGVLVALAAGAPVWAQTGLPPAPLEITSSPETVDEGVEDRGPDVISLRKITVDLRQDVDFDRIYHAPGRPGLFMRRGGAITAVFPQSVYRETKKGTFALIPAGTIFMFGDPTETDGSLPPPLAALPQAARPHASDLRQNSAPLSGPIDARISSSAYNPARQQPRSLELDDLSLLDIAAEERNRQRRLREIAKRLGPPQAPAVAID